MNQPLQGIRILDLTRLLPGPFVTQLLADMGAEIIKVETPTAGDYARLAPPEMGLGGLFEAINQGKKSVAVNYRNARGRETFLQLVATADVVIESFRPGTAERMKIDYETLRTVKPDLIYCALSGYGQTGPFAKRAGHDLNYAAISGALSLNAAEGKPPQVYGLAVADLSGAMMAGMSILGALLNRQKTGEGAYLDAALLDGILAWMIPMAGAPFFSGVPVTGGTLPLQGGLACYNVYETADGKFISLGALEPTFWSDFCKVTGRNDLLTRQFDRAVKDEVAAVFKGKSLAAWLDAFSDTDGCVEPVLSFEEALTHPQVRARGYVREEKGRLAGLNSPFAYGSGEARPAPKLGEHTREILAEILSAEELDELSQAGIIGKRSLASSRIKKQSDSD
ncbi:MAG: CoA transferase [Anaerolineae bacterium]|nr:MAG: CoA transferase [Anaerolineae bacterium]WKZ43397.1 MAG: CaiB/BaiF CoA-transferase family protein [Anaerolineales bacterium]